MGTKVHDYYYIFLDKTTFVKESVKRNAQWIYEDNGVLLAGHQRGIPNPWFVDVIDNTLGLENRSYEGTLEQEIKGDN